MENEPQFKIGDIVILKSDALKHFPIVMTVNEIGKEDPLRLCQDPLQLSLLRERGINDGKGICGNRWLCIDGTY